MARILLNDLLGEIGKLLSLQSSVPQEQDITIESTLVSGEQLANLINQRLQQRQQKNSQNLAPVLNDNDLLPFSFFDAGKKAGKSVCCLVRRIHKSEDLAILISAATDPLLRATLIKFYGIDPIEEPTQFQIQAPNIYLPYATGFLVGGDYLLTNRHVVQDKNNLDEFCAVFQYETDFRQAQSTLKILEKLDKYKFDPTFWVDSEELDYVLLKLKPIEDKSAGAQFDKVDIAQTIEGVIVPFVPKQILDTDSDLRAKINSEFSEFIARINFISPDPIHMIQHPGGRPKQVVVFNNRLVNVYENFLEYDTDAEPGSSGSPLFNTDWQVVGIHQAAIIDVDENNKRKVKGFLGVRMDCILADLRKQSLTDSSLPNAIKLQLQDFLDTYVDQKIPEKKPQIFILAGRQRKSLFAANDANLEIKAMENLRESIITEMQILEPNEDVFVVKRTSGKLENTDKEALKQAIQDINKQRNPAQQNELAIELLVNKSGVTKNRPFSIKLYYNPGNNRAQKLALSLQKLLKQDSPSFDICALPDSYTNTRGLDFCRKVNLPAVVIFVGDLDNQGDRKYIQKLQESPENAGSLAKSLAQGLLSALTALKGN